MKKNKPKASTKPAPAKPAPVRSWASARKELFTAERIKANDEEASRLLTLMEVRHSKSVTQVELARALSITQSALSKLEHQRDAKLSTLRNYIEKLGGSLVVKARFGDVEQELHFGA